MLTLERFKRQSGPGKLLFLDQSIGMIFLDQSIGIGLFLGQSIGVEENNTFQLKF